MEGNRLAAVLIASGIMIAVLAGIATPLGLYQAPEHATRLQIVDDEYTRFLLAQVLWALMLAIPAAGFVLAARQIRAPAPWLPAAAALAIVVGGVCGIIFVTLQTIDPLRYWLNGEGAWAGLASAWLTILAAALYGVAMLRTPGQGVVGYVLAAYAALGTVTLLLDAPPFFVVTSFYIVALVPAFGLWRVR